MGSTSAPDALASDAPPKYTRERAGSIVNEVEPRIRELLAGSCWPGCALCRGCWSGTAKGECKPTRNGVTFLDLLQKAVKPHAGADVHIVLRAA
jgi:hypothetical protein